MSDTQNISDMIATGGFEDVSEEELERVREYFSKGSDDE